MAAWARDTWESRCCVMDPQKIFVYLLRDIYWTLIRMLFVSAGVNSSILSQPISRFAIEVYAPSALSSFCLRIVQQQYCASFRIENESVIPETYEFLSRSCRSSSFGSWVTGLIGSEAVVRWFEMKLSKLYAQYRLIVYNLFCWIFDERVNFSFNPLRATLILRRIWFSDEDVQLNFPMQK